MCVCVCEDNYHSLTKDVGCTGEVVCLFVCVCACVCVCVCEDNYHSLTKDVGCTGEVVCYLSDAVFL